MKKSCCSYQSVIEFLSTRRTNLISRRTYHFFISIKFWRNETHARSCIIHWHFPLGMVIRSPRSRNEGSFWHSDIEIVEVSIRAWWCVIVSLISDSACSLNTGCESSTDVSLIVSPLSLFPSLTCSEKQRDIEKGKKRSRILVIFSFQSPLFTYL